MKVTLDHTLALEAKAMVVLAFRNGPIEALQVGPNVIPITPGSVRWLLPGIQGLKGVSRYLSWTRRRNHVH